MTGFKAIEVVPAPELSREQPQLPSQRRIEKPLPVVEMEAPKLVVPKDVPKPKLEARLEPPKLQPAKFDAPKLQPITALPHVIHTGEFGSSPTATVSAPIQKVQTGGFGDPNGLPGQGKPARLVTATMGSFDLPTGPGTGNGTGGSKGVKGTIASAGFGSGVNQPGQPAGFAAPGTRPVAARAESTKVEQTTPVEILYKPKPVYSEEARKLNIEGEVLLEVMFAANGELHVNRVVRGLGHGLDEAAVTAAGKIKFKPAQRNGSPVDSIAIVHVTFQIAS
jgi:TonB family protein